MKLTILLAAGAVALASVAAVAQMQHPNMPMQPPHRMGPPMQPGDGMQHGMQGMPGGMHGNMPGQAARLRRRAIPVRRAWRSRAST